MTDLFDMPQLREIKILVFSENSDFWAPQLKSIRLPHKIEYAKNSDICQFLISEWMADFCIYDGETIPLNQIQSITQSCQTPVVFLGVRNQLEEKTLLKHLQVGMDKSLTSNTSNEMFNKVLSHFSKKWLAHVDSSSFHAEKPSKEITWENLVIYPNDYIVKVDGQLVSTSPVQFRLLISFISNEDQLLTRDWLKEYVWDGAKISPRSIDAQISKLKRTLPCMNTFIVNIYGKGYLLSSDSKKQAS